MNEVTVYDEIEQGSEDWLQLRCGMLTASNVKLLFTATHTPSTGKTPQTHAHELLAQRITGHVETTYLSADMERGNIEEGIAREAYSESHDLVREVGFITRQFEMGGIKFVLGYSPDALVDYMGCIEIKSRCQKFQMRTIIEGGYPDEYKIQIQTGLLVSGREWCDFVSVCGGMPLYTYRVEPDLRMFEKIKGEALKFEKMLQANETTYMLNTKGMTITERLSDDWTTDLGITGIGDAPQ